jgi:DNA-directed RNA polymerase subunit RPC12/RpoP
MKADCQHCGVHIGEIGDEPHAMYKFCPYCSRRILPVMFDE